MGGGGSQDRNAYDVTTDPTEDFTDPGDSVADSIPGADIEAVQAKIDAFAEAGNANDGGPIPPAVADSDESESQVSPESSEQESESNDRVDSPSESDDGTTVATGPQWEEFEPNESDDRGEQLQAGAGEGPAADEGSDGGTDGVTAGAGSGGADGGESNLADQWRNFGDENGDDPENGGDADGDDEGDLAGQWRNLGENDDDETAGEDGGKMERLQAAAGRQFGEGNAGDQAQDQDQDQDSSSAGIAGGVGGGVGGGLAGGIGGGGAGGGHSSTAGGSGSSGSDSGSSWETNPDEWDPDNWRADLSEADQAEIDQQPTTTEIGVDAGSPSPGKFAREVLHPGARARHVRAGEDGHQAVPIDSDGDRIGDWRAFDRSDVETAEKLDPSADGRTSDYMNQVELSDDTDAARKTAFETEYDNSETGFGVPTRENAHSQLATFAALDAMGVRVPRHTYDTDTDKTIVESVGGSDYQTVGVKKLGSKAVADRADPEQFVDIMAANIVVGNPDLHPENLMIGEDDGAVVAFDLDFTSTYDDEGSFRYGLRQTVGRSIWKLNDERTEPLEVTTDDVLARAGEIAEELKKTGAVDRVAAAAARYDDFFDAESECPELISNRIRTNVERLSEWG